MSRVTKLPYLDTLQQTPASAPTPADAAPTAPSPRANAVGANNPSDACLAILQARLPLEKMVDYARNQIAFYEPLSANDFARQELAFNRTLLTDAVNDLAAFDAARLTEEARTRLTAFGMAFSGPSDVGAKINMAAE